MTVLATAPANAPHSRDSSALDLGLKSCLDKKTHLIAAILSMLSQVILTNSDPGDNPGYLYDFTHTTNFRDMRQSNAAPILNQLLLCQVLIEVL